MVSDTHGGVCMLLSVGTSWLKEARFSSGGLWVFGAYLAVCPCLCWLAAGSKPSSGSGWQVNVVLDGSLFSCWMPMGSKPSDDRGWETEAYIVCYGNFKNVTVTSDS